MIVKLTQEQRDSLIGVEFLPHTYFNLDLKDVYENYIIHETEINQCNIQWLKQLPLEDYKPKEDLI